MASRADFLRARDALQALQRSQDPEAKVLALALYEAIATGDPYDVLARLTRRAELLTGTGKPAPEPDMLGHIWRAAVPTAVRFRESGGLVDEST